MSEREKLEALIVRLWKAANVKEDAPKEVRDLLKGLQMQVAAFDDYIEEAKKDGVIDENEFEKLMNLRNSLITKAVELAQADASITDEEFELLDMLSKISIDLIKR